MTSVLKTVDTSHEDLIHDAALDYYGLKLATCSSDCSVKIFDVTKQSLLEDLRGHEGPVWQVSWSHPMFGNYLASCSYDKRVIVWRENTSTGKYQQFYEYTGHESSVNSVCWGPAEYGLVFACASSDKTVSVVSFSGDGNWHARKIDNAHPMGCNAVSWAPVFASLQQDVDQQQQQQSTVTTQQQQAHHHHLFSAKRIVTGGSDNTVKIWREETSNGGWVLDHELHGHVNWVRDVAWSPNIIHSKTSIASCAQDGKLIIWSCDLNESSSGSSLNAWKKVFVHDFNSILWHVSWSLTSNMLAVSGGDNKVTIWKEDHSGHYVCINDNTSSNSSSTASTVAATTTTPAAASGAAIATVE